MDIRTRQWVRRRAGDVCEYCHVPQAAVLTVTFHVEHTIARQHGGGDDPRWLALACDRCNVYKGTNLTSIDPLAGDVVFLYNPRTDVWEDHFRHEGAVIVGLTPSGRATVRLLKMNAPPRVQLRLHWLEEHGPL